MFMMADSERKKLTWTIKKKLFNLSSDELLQLAKCISQEPTQAKLVNQDEESCIDYVCSYMESTALLESDDQGMSQLLDMKKIIDEIIAMRTKSDVISGAGADVHVVSDANVFDGVHTDTHVTDHTDTHVTGHTDTHVADTHSDTAPVDLVAQTEALELQISKLMSTS